tara:strand:+ start:66 stop:452 length:387 start_codon:yes stop_codon:yes gene_type:complete
MRLSKRQLKRIIREEYSRLKRRGLIREFGVASGADFAEMSGAGDLEQAVQGILSDCQLVSQGGKVQGIGRSGNGCDVKVDVWLNQNGFIDDLYGAIDNPFVEEVLMAVEDEAESMGRSIFCHYGMMGE